MGSVLSLLATGTGPRPDYVLQPGQVFEGYRVVRLLDAGMGVVYEAAEVASDDRVAIKLLQPGHAKRKDFVRRFQQECRVYPKLKHPNIVRMRRADVAKGGVPFIVMDLLEGRTLRELLEKHRFDVLNALYVMSQVSHAMQFAHEKGIEHRDLKPENLMITTRGKEKGHVYVLDFGIARMAGGMTTDDLPTVGTARYMAPEQARSILRPAKSGRRVKTDHRVDIYAFGVIFYELLTGKHTFINDEKRAKSLSFEETLAGHLSAEPLPVYALAYDCPTSVWEVIKQCIAIDPDARYPSFEDVGEALRELITEVIEFEHVPKEHVLVRQREQEKEHAARRAAFEVIAQKEAAAEAEEAAAAARAGAGAGAGTGADAGTDAGTDADAGTGAGTDADAGTGAGTDADAGTGADTGAGADTDAGAVAGGRGREPASARRAVGTAPLGEFVATTSPLPFRIKAPDEAVPVPSGRGRGFTVRIPKVASEEDAFDDAGDVASARPQGAPTTPLPVGRGRGFTMKIPRSELPPPRAEEEARGAAPPEPRRVSEEPSASSITPPRMRTDMMVMIGLIGLLTLLSATSLVIALRAEQRAPSVVLVPVGSAPAAVSAPIWVGGPSVGASAAMAPSTAAPPAASPSSATPSAAAPLMPAPSAQPAPAESSVVSAAAAPGEPASAKPSAPSTTAAPSKPSTPKRAPVAAPARPPSKPGPLIDFDDEPPAKPKGRR